MEEQMVEVITKYNKDISAWNLHFKYSKWESNQVQGIIGIIKTHIPSSDRLYDPVSHEWTIAEKHWQFIMSLITPTGWNIKEEKIISAEDFFYNDFVDNTPKESKDSLAAKLVALLDITAQDLQDSGLLKKAYRRKAIEWHPDKNGGDGSKMSELNSIWSQYNAN